MTSGARALAALPATLQDLVHEAAAVLPDRAEGLRGRGTRHRMLGRFLRDAALLEWCGMTVPGIEAGREAAIDHLLSLQSPGGTFRSGDNVDSPPDSAFTVNDLALTQALQREPGIDALLSAARRALVHGGVHTPNHRWEISAALARLSALYGWQDCRDRAEQWLAEGVDLQPDGMFSERSANYAAHVSIPSLLILARELDRTDLLTAADTATLVQAKLTSPDGTVETLASRRQDQVRPFDGGAMLPLFHAHAVRTGDPLTGRAALRVLPRADGNAALTLVALGAEDPRTIGALPLPAAEPDAENPEIIELATSGLAVVDLGTSRTVLHGGTDTQALGRVTSGGASNPTFARLSGRQLAVSDLRLSRDFFSLGPLRPAAPVRSGVLSWTLTEQLQAEYFQPLTGDDLSATGEYGLEHNGRFAAAMAFSRRRTDLISLRTEMTAQLRLDGVDLRWEVEGPPTALCLMLALEGIRDEGGDDGEAVLRPIDGQSSATARFRSRDGGEELLISARGSLGGAAFYDPGESFTFVGGTDEPHGRTLLIPATSTSPLELSLSILRR